MIGESSRGSVIGGGEWNTNRAEHSVIPGGVKNAIASGADHAFAAGHRAKANHLGTFVWADSQDTDFASLGANTFLIRAANGVGVNTTLPQASLHVVGSGDRAIFGVSSGNYGVYGSGATAGVYGGNSSSSGSGVFGRAFHTTGVNHGVQGQSDSVTDRGVYGHTTAALGVTIGVYGISESAQGYDFYADGAGVDYGGNSSIRWKRNIQPIPDPLGMLGQIRAVYFDWDEEHGGKHDIGFIGEEVGKVLPEIVGYGPDGEYVTGMDYGKMTPLLAASINALRAEKDAEIAELKARLEKLEQILTRTSQEANHALCECN